LGEKGVFMADKNKSLEVQGTAVKIKTVGTDDFICLTDIAISKNPEHPDDLIRNWLRNRNTLDLLKIWEQLHNPNFNPVEFDGIRKQAGLNSFTLTPKQWIEQVNAVGIQSKAGRYGGTYAHKDIAFEFASWISVEFKLYLINEFQRLKEEERKTLGWDIRRNLAKLNYRIHTDAVQKHLVPKELTLQQINIIYSTEADILNVALFGRTASQWRKDNLIQKGNMRDEADVAQLVCLSNLENLNALFISEGLDQKDRLRRLNKIAIEQMTILMKDFPQTLGENSSCKKRLAEKK